MAIPFAYGSPVVDIYWTPVTETPTTIAAEQHSPTRLSRSTRV